MRFSYSKPSVSVLGRCGFDNLYTAIFFKLEKQIYHHLETIFDVFFLHVFSPKPL